MFTLAVLGANLYLAAFVHLLLAYPEGRIRRRAHRRLVAGGYALALLGPLPILMFGFDAHCADCPELGDPGLRRARRSATIARRR